MLRCVVGRRSNGLYVAKCVELAVSGAGSTPAEALESLREALELYREQINDARGRGYKVQVTRRAFPEFVLLSFLWALFYYGLRRRSVQQITRYGTAVGLRAPASQHTGAS